MFISHPLAIALRTLQFCFVLFYAGSDTHNTFRVYVAALQQLSSYKEMEEIRVVEM